MKKKVTLSISCFKQNLKLIAVLLSSEINSLDNVIYFKKIKSKDTNFTF